MFRDRVNQALGRECMATDSLDRPVRIEVIAYVPTNYQH
jgi:hypothetical protein